MQAIIFPFFVFVFFFFGICTKNGLLLNFLGAQKGKKAAFFRFSLHPMFDEKKKQNKTGR